MSAALFLRRGTPRRVLVTCATVVATTLALGAPARAETSGAGQGPTPVPTSSYATTVGADAADVYHPRHGSRELPVALLLQGANVDKAHYEQYARGVAAHGFVVVVPNHRRTVFGVPGLWPSPDQVPAAVAWAEAEDTREGGPLAGRIDEDTLTLLGHSMGGAAGLAAVQGECVPPLCSGLPPGATRPSQLKAAAFFGTHNIPPGQSTVAPIVNTGVPVALIAGDADGKTVPEDVGATYEQLQETPKVLVTLKGVNHYGINDTQNPPGAAPDPIAQTADQQRSIRTAARWSALYLKARLGDRLAEAYVHRWGDVLDPEVTVRQDH